MTLPTKPGERDDHANDPPDTGGDAAPRRNPIERAARKGASAGGMRFTPGGAAVARGGGQPFVLKLFENDEDRDGVEALWPAPWIPTEEGAVRTDLIASVHVKAYFDGVKTLYNVELTLMDGAQATVRGAFSDSGELAAWVDAAFPGAGFLESFPKSLEAASDGSEQDEVVRDAQAQHADDELGFALLRPRRQDGPPWPIGRPPRTPTFPGPRLPWGSGPRSED
jgi:hypothetical protein